MIWLDINKRIIKYTSCTFENTVGKLTLSFIAGLSVAIVAISSINSQKPRPDLWDFIAIEEDVGFIEEGETKVVGEVVVAEYEVVAEALFILSLTLPLTLSSPLLNWIFSNNCLMVRSEINCGQSPKSTANLKQPDGLTKRDNDVDKWTLFSLLRSYGAIKSEFLSRETDVLLLFSFLISVFGDTVPE